MKPDSTTWTWMPASTLTIKNWNEAVHISESHPFDGPFCAVCRHGNIELNLYRSEWWCEECISAEEAYEHDMAIGG